MKFQNVPYESIRTKIGVRAAAIGLAILVTCVASVTLSAAATAGTNTAVPVAAPAPTPPASGNKGEKVKPPEGSEGWWIKVVHNGAYLASFTVTWDEPRKPDQSRTEKGKEAGFTKTFEFPDNATNIRLKIENDTGLVWQPQREIFNRTLGKSDLNKCYKITGTTLGSTYDTSCTEGEMEEDEDEPEDNASGKTWITLIQDGAFTAHFTVTWDEAGKPGRSRKDTGKTAGFRTTIEFPDNATNIRLKIENDTGLVWEPKREIFNKLLGKAGLNRCYRATGTTLSSTYDDQCK